MDGPSSFNYKKAWQEVDSFGKQAKPESAKKAALKILRIADSLGDRPQVIKTKCWIYTFEKIQDKDPTDIIKKTEKEVLSADNSIDRAIWCNIAAKTYEIYISENGYILYDRARLKDTIKEDISTWDINTIEKRMRYLYLASIQNKNELQSTDYRAYLPIVTQEVHTEKLRNSLYDLLAADAIQFLSRSNQYSTNAIDPFKINDARYFAPVKKFIERPLPSRDSNNAGFQTMWLYQNILSHHISQQQTDALIDADISRIAYIYSKANLPNLDSLYIDALDYIVRQYPGNAYAGQAKYLILNHIYQHYKDYKPKYTLKDIHDSLRQLVEQYPNGEG
ncbi:hypothetical protein DBR32_00870 [Taibaiella sp. KBW10]|nr:hypothetical protein DBR32_00870 [Taibaiella sp. KBW10]